MQAAPNRSPDEARAEALGHLCGVGFVLVLFAVGVILGLRRLWRGRRQDENPSQRKRA